VVVSETLFIFHDQGEPRGYDFLVLTHHLHYRAGSVHLLTHRLRLG
jgi:hypothetical protein